jgi:hypothetical protein
MVTIWAQVFAINGPSHQMEDTVTDYLVALREEIDVTQMLLVEKYNVPAELLQPGFQRLRDTASPGRIHSGWMGLKGNIQSPECRHAFLWSAWLLRDELEGDMQEEELGGLYKEMTALEEALNDSDMSDYLRTFVARQIEVIRKALRLYRVQGVRPVNEAIKSVAGAVSLGGPRLKAEMASADCAAQSVLSRASNWIKKTAEVCGDLEKIKKTGESAAGLAGELAPLLIQFASKVAGA